MDFLAAKRRVARSAPVSILFATNLAAIVRARIALWDVAYLMNKDVAQWRKATAEGAVWSYLSSVCCRLTNQRSALRRLTVEMPSTLA